MAARKTNEPLFREEIEQIFEAFRLVNSRIKTNKSQTASYKQELEQALSSTHAAEELGGAIEMLYEVLSDRHPKRNVSVDRSAELIAMYVGAINRIRKGVNDANAEFATHTFVGSNGMDSADSLANNTAELLSENMTDDEFQTRLALERRTIDSALLETGILLKTLGLMMNEGYAAIANDFNFDIQKNLIKKETPFWFRIIPFYVRLKTRKKINSRFSMGKNAAGRRLQDFYSSYFSRAQTELKERRPTS